MSLNLHENIGDALSILSPWQTLIFTKTLITYSLGQDTPNKTKSFLTLRGKIQPANPSEIKQLGFNLNDFQYYKVFITGTPDSLSKLDGFSSDTFKTNSKEFKIISKTAWDSCFWRECLAVRKA